MAHLMKSNRAATGGLTRHYERFKNDKGEYIKFGNQEINIDNTNLNYNLAEDKNQLDFIRQRTSEVRCLNRKDVNIMANWVITLPESIKSLDDQEKFFKESYNFLEEKYAKENVISSFVHLDESTPHMHFSFIPVVYDKKREDYKVSAKECITRNDLKKFHPELEKYMEKVFGREIGIMNEKTREGNKSIDELKRETATEKVNNLKEEIKDKELSLNSLKKDLKALEKDLRITGKVKDIIGNINDIEVTRPLFQKDKVTLSKSSYESLTKIAKWSLVDKEKSLEPYKKELNIYKKENKDIKNYAIGLQDQIEGLKEKKLKFSLDELKEQVKDKSEIEDLKSELRKLKSFIERNNLTNEFHKQKSKTRSFGIER